MKSYEGKLDKDKKVEALALCLKFAGKTSKDAIERLEKHTKKHGTPNLSAINITRNKTWNFNRKKKIPTLVMLATQMAERFIFELKK